MDPINYQLNVATPFQNALQGYQAGAAIRQNQLQQQQQEAQMQAAQQQRKVIGDLIANKNPTAADFANATLAVPGYKDQLDQAWKLRSVDQQQNMLNDTGQVYAALSNNQPQVAADILTKKADAMEAAGASPQEVASNRALAEMTLKHPDFARAKAGMMLMTLPGGDKVIESLSKMNADNRAEGLQPSAVAKAEADASSAATTAKFAESKAVMDLKMSGEQIKKWAADTEIARQNARIAAMNASIAREGNDLKREELRLKIQDAVTARDEKLRGKVAEVDSARSTIDNTINTIDKLFKNPAWKDVVGSFEGRMPEAASMLDDNESNAIATINTIGSQVFLSAVKSAGSMTGLTEKEGDKLQNSLASMVRAQGEEAFETNAKEAQRLLLKARKNLVTKYGVPDTVPDTPEAGANPSEIDALLKKYGGK